jgi:hypothetical protein
MSKFCNFEDSATTTSGKQEKSNMSQPPHQIAWLKDDPEGKGNKHKVHKDTNLPTFGGMDAYKEKEHKPPQQMHNA